MTNERTDYAAEDDIPWSDHGRLMTLPPDPHERIADALEALVEQQRIQNLIALSQALDGNGWQAAEPLDSIFAYRNAEPHDEFGGLHIRPEIAAALGIEEVQS
ncbi:MULTISPECIES: hypothetical protein [unclassified Leucobacter]|uniref:hypothetical protein n=1 Tax=unclassified Leucobacter TaxID=2621730 RepID=UPI003018062E